MNERQHIVVNCPVCRTAVGVVNPYYVFVVHCPTCRADYSLEYEELVDPDGNFTDSYWLGGPA